MSAPASRCRPVAAALALLAAVHVAGAPTPAPSRAGAAAMDVRASLGFSDTFRPGSWAPVTVTVSNRGPDVVGELEVQLSDGDEFRGQRFDMTHRRRLELNRGARKRFHFTVFVEGLTRPVVARVVVGGREAARHTLDPRRQFSADRLLLVLSRDANLDPLNDAHGRSLRVVYPHPERLPQRWQGYDGVAAVVLHGLSLERLDPEQYEALHRWLAAGGILVVSGGPDYALLRTPRLAALLPARPVGTVAVNDAAAVGEALGAELAGDRMFLVNRLAPTQAQVTHRAGALPLVVERRLGRGRVVYLTFDVALYPFQGWTAMADVWRQVLRLPGEGPVLASVPDDADLDPVKSMLGGVDTGFPPHATVLFFLALYLVTLATGCRLRPAGRAGRAMRSLCTWGLPLLAAPAAWLLFSSVLFERGAAAAVVTVVEPLAGSAFARVQLHLGMHSNRRQRLRLGYDGLDPGFRVPARSRPEAGAEAWVFSHVGHRTLEAMDDRAYALHLLEGRDVVLFALSASLELGAGEARLRVRNDSGRPLADAWLVAKGRAYALGEIGADSVFERVLNVGRDAVPAEKGVWPTVPGDASRAGEPEHEAARAVLARELERIGETPRGGALLVARTGGLFRLTGASARWPRRELTVVLLRFPLTESQVDAAHTPSAGGAPR